jgi:hypothetical protein
LADEARQRGGSGRSTTDARTTYVVVDDADGRPGGE